MYGSRLCRLAISIASGHVSMASTFERLPTTSAMTRVVSPLPQHISRMRSPGFMPVAQIDASLHLT
ncbi:hypothetical protein AMJ39_08665 [candidate division TA06 bacterium DG_24]|uniref:Uncharacterized protein n=1 Tax=candidate division TA06 bacterium DG_24 TaxID=1703770 RepID=A0A0S7WPK4_UNCT6|nr:MAG: hypothetical protein AMJ39_08665 [candidate division TA06 bacterium DG_24]